MKLYGEEGNWPLIIQISNNPEFKDSEKYEVELEYRATFSSTIKKEDK